MDHNWIIFINAINIFPVILVSSSMKLVLGQIFHVNMTHSTIVSYAGIISAFKFLWINIIKERNLWKGNTQGYKQWALVGSFLMTITLLVIYGALNYYGQSSSYNLALIITLLSTIVLIGDIINETAVSILYTHHKNPQVSSMIFMGHKVSAFLAYFLFPMVVDYIGFHPSFITYIILSFILNLSIFYLPNIEITPTIKKDNILQLMVKDLGSIPHIFLIIIFVLTCQMGTLIISGMKCNFIAQVTKKKLLSYLLRGIGLVVGTITGGFINKLKNKFQDHEFFLGGALLHILSIAINWAAFNHNNTALFIIATLFDNINKGFMMAFLTKFFIENSQKKPHILTFFWGLFSLLRSFYGGISGYLISQWGIFNLFFFMMIMAIIPIIVPFIIKKKIND